MSDKKKEIAVVLSPCNNDNTVVIIKGTEEQPTGVEVLRKVEEGQPIHGEVVTLSKREDGAYDVDRMTVPGPVFSHGPAQIATKDYRNNYDRIFRKDLN